MPGSPCEERLERSTSADAAAVHSGIPVVRVGRGNTQGFVPLRGSNLTSTKAPRRS